MHVSRPQRNEQARVRRAGRGSLARACIEALEGRRMLSAEIVNDINAVHIPVPAAPADLTVVGNVAFFSVNDADHGRCLWKTDGTEAGTVYVKDVAPANLRAVGQTLFFTSGEALWKSDGTAGGTVMIKQFAPVEATSHVGNLADANGTLFFTADDGASGSELWKSDGTAAGTVLVKDIKLGSQPTPAGGSSVPNSSAPAMLTSVNGKMFFTADDGVHGRELWVSDGTAAGTALVKDAKPGSGSSVLSGFTYANSRLYYFAKEGDQLFRLWYTSGTEAGTGLVLGPSTSFTSIVGMVAANNSLFLSAYDNWMGSEPRIIDLQADGMGSLTITNLSIDYQYSYGRVVRSSVPDSLTNVNGRVFYTADDQISGRELYYATPGGSAANLVADMVPGKAGFEPVQLINVNGTLFFTRARGTSLYKSDGTASGTVKVADGISPPSNPGSMAALNGVLLMFSPPDDAGNSCLYKSDGTTAGTGIVKKLMASDTTGSSSPRNLINFNGTLFFTADDGIHGRELWKSDPTVGTVLVKDIRPGYNGSDPADLAIVNGTLLFTVVQPDGNRVLWKTDGTWEGTMVAGDGTSYEPTSLYAGKTRLYVSSDGIHGTELWAATGGVSAMIKDIRPGQEGSQIELLEAYNGAVFFIANDGNGVGLWKSDGTAGGTSLVKYMGSAEEAAEWFYTSACTDHALFIEILDSYTFGGALWKSDGTEVGTIELVDGLFAYNLKAVNGTLFFVASDYSAQPASNKLWKSDGTVAGTALVSDRFTGDQSIVTSLGGKLYFIADDGVHGPALWQTDGTVGGTVMVKDINPGNGNPSLNLLTVQNGRMFFLANDGTHGRELWVSDGSEAGTMMLKDISPGSESTNLSWWKFINGKFFFLTGDNTRGTKLWMSDGTVAGTSSVRDGLVGSQNVVTSFGNMIYFMADDGVHGMELWKTDGTAEGTVMVKDINPGTESTVVNLLVVNDGAMYFMGFDKAHGLELWKTDGTVAGTAMVKDIMPGNGGTNISNPACVENLLVFSANGSWWRSDGSEAGTMPLAASGASPTGPISVGDTVFYVGSDSVHGEELWKQTTDVPPATIKNRVLTLNVTDGDDAFTLESVEGKVNVKLGARSANFDPADFDTLGIPAGGGRDLLSIVSGSFRLAGNAALAGLSLAAGAKLDLAENDLVLHATADNRQQVLAQVAGWIKAGRGNGTWNGVGLSSSTARANKRTGLALMLNEKNGKPILSTFDGQTVNENDILVKYTWNGDVNLDGMVDAADYFLVDSGFITQAGQYRNGDLTLDGTVDAGDYFLIDSAFIAQTGTLAAKKVSPLQELFSTKPLL